MGFASFSSYLHFLPYLVSWSDHQSRYIVRDSLAVQIGKAGGIIATVCFGLMLFRGQILPAILGDERDPIRDILESAEDASAAVQRAPAVLRGGTRHFR